MGDRLGTLRVVDLFFHHFSFDSLIFFLIHIQIQNDRFFMTTFFLKYLKNKSFKNRMPLFKGIASSPSPLPSIPFR
jgi:hypothetical protein